MIDIRRCTTEDQTRKYGIRNADGLLTYQDDDEAATFSIVRPERGHYVTVLGLDEA